MSSVILKKVSSLNVEIGHSPSIYTGVRGAGEWSVQLKTGDAPAERAVRSERRTRGGVSALGQDPEGLNTTTKGSQRSGRTQVMTLRKLSLFSFFEGITTA